MTIKYNKSSFCILPVLNIDRESLQWNTNLINCYIGIKEYPEYDNHVILLYTFKDSNSIKQLDFIFSQNKLFVNHIVYTNKTADYFIYIFNSELLKEVLPLFKKGKYSKFSQSYKDQIERIHKVTPNKKLYHILRKTDKLRKELEFRIGDKIPKENDLWSIPYKKDEILTLKNLK